MSVKTKNSYPTQQQLRRLLELLNEDEELRCGKFSQNFTRKTSIRRWEAIAEELNSIPGAKKIWKDWKKTYQDKKSKAKNKAATIKRLAQRATGGGSPPPPLDDNDNLLLNALSQESIMGHSAVQESIVKFLDVSHADSSADINGNDYSELVLTTDVMTELQTSDTVLELTSNTPQTSGKVVDLNTSQTPATVATTKQKKTTAQRRLQKSIETASNIKETLKEQNKINKTFHEDFLVLMRSQTEIMQSISESLKLIANK